MQKKRENFKLNKHEEKLLLAAAESLLMIMLITKKKKVAMKAKEAKKTESSCNLLHKTTFRN